MKRLLDLIYMGVRLDGVDSLLPAPALSIFVFPHQPLRLEGVPSSRLAASPPPLSNSSPLLSPSPPSSTLPFRP
jgi:hypothetical protein